MAGLWGKIIPMGGTDNMLGKLVSYPKQLLSPNTYTSWEWTLPSVSYLAR
jgi:hypothetical protein